MGFNFTNLFSCLYLVFYLNLMVRATVRGRFQKSWVHSAKGPSFEKLFVALKLGVGGERKRIKLLL